MPCARLRAGRHLGDDEAALEHGPLPLLVLRRVEYVDPAGDHSDRAAFEGPVVRRAVDASRQPRYDGDIVPS